MFEMERIGKQLEELKKHIYPHMQQLFGYQIKKGKQTFSEAVLPDGWKEFHKNDRWGGDLEEDRHYWFRIRLVIPAELDGKTVIYHVKTGVESGWDLANPQLVVYVNGTLIQGLDIRHREIVLCERAKQGDVYEIYLFAYCGIHGGLVELESQISGLDRETEGLYYDINSALEVAKALEDQDIRRIEILHYLTHAVNLVDFRKPASESYYSSVVSAREYLKCEFYDKYCNENCPTVACIGHTHIDVAWQWTLSQTREKVVRSFSTVLNLMKDYPEYLFMSSQPQLYEYLKEEEPEQYEEVKRRIQEGRWEPEGGMWVEADCNVTGGESLVRQILFGTRFFREEFGVENEILWLPDVFGYSAAMPQIMAKSNLKYFMTTKLGWNELNGMPYDTFFWRGIDGTEVLTHFITAQSPTFMPTPHAVSYNGRIDAPHLISSWKKYQEKFAHDEVLMAFGYGDGGGGPTKTMLEASRRFAKGIPGCPKTKMKKALDYFHDLDAAVRENPKLPKWVGELYLEFHRGTLTTMARNKRANRKAEFLYREAELWSAVGNQLFGKHYPRTELNSGWKLILLNQFHDIIPGSSIKEVYEDSQKDYEAVFEIGNQALQQAYRNICDTISIAEEGIVVFNQLSRSRSDVVSVVLPEDFRHVAVTDETGRVIPSQESADGKLTFFAENVPSMGYKVFGLKSAAKTASSDSLIATPKVLENQFFRIQLNEAAEFVSVYDKINDREVLKSGERGNVLQAFEDKPHQYDAWEIAIYYEEKMWEISDVKSVEVIENGPVFATLRVVKQFVDSLFSQDIVIYRDIPRIDFVSTVDWKERDILVKAAFPVDISTDKATYEIQYGSLERPTHKNTTWDIERFEVSGQKWADVSEAGYGVSLLNDCKYGYDVRDSNLRLTLLRCPTDPNTESDREMHYFTYSLYPHQGDWRVGGTVGAAYDLNCPLCGVIASAHSGSLPQEFSFASVSADNVILDTVKKAEDSDAMILRVYESQGKRTNTTIQCCGKLTEVKECDLMENVIGEVSVNENGFDFTIKPYEIKTFQIGQIVR